MMTSTAITLPGNGTSIFHINDVYGSLIVEERNKSHVLTYQRDYSINGISSASWSEIVSSLPSNVTRIHIFDSCGEPVMVGKGTAGNEVETFRIAPGGDGAVDLSIEAGARLSVKTVSGTVNDGKLLINFLA